jgi:hypothetical protein
MSSDQRGETERYGDYQRDHAIQQAEYERRQHLCEAVDAGHRALGGGRAELLPRLLHGRPDGPLDGGLVGELLPRTRADLEAIDEVARQSDRWAWRPVMAVWEHHHGRDGRGQPDPGAYRRAFESLAALAEWRGVVPSDVQRSVPVQGHELQLGQQQVAPNAGTPSVHRIVDPASHPPVAAFQGLPGFGKTTAMTAAVEDRYAAGKKVVDVADLAELENGLYDLPQSQDGLRDVREELGLPPDFRAADGYDPPDVEILVPLHRGLDDCEVPVRAKTDDGGTETVVRPFTIPAGEVSRKALNLMLSHLTDVQQTYLDRAYQSLAAEGEEWSLRDLADAVLETDAQDGVKRRIYNTLAALQSAGFIRHSDCDHALDWERVFRDDDTITVFSQSLLEDSAHKFMVLSYIVHSLYHERQQHDSLPSLVAVFRELHGIAPNDATASEDERERELQSGIVAAFQELCSMHRHEDIEVLADTQQIMGQVNKRAREQVERVVSFRSQYGTLKNLFSDMVGLDDDRYHYMNKIARRFETGEAAIIGKTGMDSDLEMTISWAPPMCHHLDQQDGHGSGWRARVALSKRYDCVPTEEFDDAPWDPTVPEALQFERLELEEEELDVQTFVEACLQPSEGDRVTADRVDSTARSWANHNDTDAPSRKALGMAIKKVYDGVNSYRERQDGEKVRFYDGLTLSPTGHRFTDDNTDATATAD